MRQVAWLLAVSSLVIAPVVIDGQSADESFKQGAASHERGDFAAAEAGYKAAIAADASRHDAHHNLGALYAQQQRWREAENVFRRAVALKPADPWSAGYLIDVLVRLNRAEEGVAVARQLASVSDGEHARALLARALLAANRPAEACRDFQRALNFNSGNEALRLELAACYAQADDLEPAELHAAAVVASQPENAAAVALLEAIHREQRFGRWFWAPVVGFLVAGLAAVGARGAEQWGQRRVAFGVMATSVGALFWLQEGSLFWLSGGFWGAYQFYAAHRFRRTRSTRLEERTQYLQAAATALGCIALADGDLQPAELKLIRETYERGGYTDADLRIIGETLRGCASTFSAQLFEHRTLYATLRDACTRFAAASNEAARLELFRTAVRVALADSHATVGERKAVEACGTWLNVSESERDQVWRQQSGETGGGPVVPMSSDE